MGQERPLILPSCLWPGGFQLSMIKHLIVSSLNYLYWYFMIELHLCNLYNYQPAVFPEHIPSWLGPLTCFPRFSMPPCKEHTCLGLICIFIFTKSKHFNWIDTPYSKWACRFKIQIIYKKYIYFGDWCLPFSFTNRIPQIGFWGVTWSCCSLFVVTVEYNQHIIG